MASNFNNRKDSVQLSDWQLFTNNGTFNNPLPPGRRLRKRNAYFQLEVNSDYVRYRCRSAKSRSKKTTRFCCRLTHCFRFVQINQQLAEVLDEC